VTGVESDNGQLRVVERYDLHNESTPPRTQWSNRSFEVILPEDAVLGDVSAQRPGASSLPTSVKLDPEGPKGHFAFNFPIQPDEGGKGTLFQIQYNLPYTSGKYTFHPVITLPADTVWIVLPKSMTFSGTGFESSPQDPTVQTFMARNVTPGKEIAFSISGTGAFLGGLALLLAAVAAFLLRKPVTPGVAAPAGAAAAVANAAPASPGAKNSALLNALKEELFALESERIAGTLPAHEYAEQKAALETVLKRALKRQ
jgi:hypothetical protein